MSLYMEEGKQLLQVDPVVLNIFKNKRTGFPVQLLLLDFAFDLFFCI